MENKYYEFCYKTYSYEYESYMNTCERNSKGNILIDSIKDKWDKEAQKSAIRCCIIEGLKYFKNPCVSQLWNAIYQVHLFRKSGIGDIETIQKVISAEQSWKKSSGHAFEEVIKELSSLSLKEYGIEIILQRDLNILLKNDELKNEPRDLSWLREQVKGNIFDLYCIVNDKENKYCFGCVQCKTSIRDRVTRDREPSLHAMESFFWSVAFVLDGDFLKLPKFKYMVNGGSKEFPSNGWHGMYVLSEKEIQDRIYPLTIDFEIFINHALQASKQWLEQRQWFNKTWKAQ